MGIVASYKIENHISSISAKLQNLRTLRTIYWPRTISDLSRQHTIKQGLAAIEHQVNIRIRKVIGVEKPYRDGITPLSGNIIFVAQHATATCCRTCMQQWHNFSKQGELSEEELAYSIELILAYIKEEIPELYEKERA